MHTTVAQAVALVETLQDGLRDRARQGRHLPTPIVCPPFVSLTAVRELMDTELMRLGAQNCHWEREGPYTGEVSPAMLEGLVDYVMVGHSERRALGETDDQVARKAGAVAEAGLIPIIFAGEEEPTEAARKETEDQLMRRLSEIDVSRHDLLAVYEPKWAIGADHAADAEHVHAHVASMKDRLRELGAADPRIIYGGTVNESNVDQFMELEILDGVGATRASLDPDAFFKMLDRMAGGAGR